MTGSEYFMMNAHANTIVVIGKPLDDKDVMAA